MLSISDLETLRRAYSVHDDLSYAEAMRRIGNPSAKSLIDFAVAQMSHPDRNARALALRLLRHQQGEIAMRGVLLGLNDEKRRVCAIAIQACPNYLAYEEIVAGLEAIVRDDSRTRKLRRRALSMLAGNDGRHQGELPTPLQAALTRLLPDSRFRFSILFGLARLDLTPRVKALLERLADSESERERDLARRALQGERVVHIDAYANDALTQQRIMETCDIAHGRMFYWIPRTGMPVKTLPPS